MPRSPGGLRPHFMGQRHRRQRSKTSLTPITSSTTYSNLQRKTPSPPRRKHTIITRGSTTTSRLVTKTGLLCPSPISGHTDAYRRSSGPSSRHQTSLSSLKTSYGITDSMSMSLSKPLELVMDTEAWHPAGHVVTKSQTRLSN